MKVPVIKSSWISESSQTKVRNLESVMLTRTWGSRPRPRPRTWVSRPRPRPRTWASRPRPRPRTWDSRPRPRPRTWLKSLSQGQGLEEARTKDQGQGHIIGLKNARQFPEVSRKVSRNLESFHSKVSGKSPEKFGKSERKKLKRNKEIYA